MHGISPYSHIALPIPPSFTNTNYIQFALAFFAKKNALPTPFDVQVYFQRPYQETKAIENQMKLIEPRLKALHPGIALYLEKKAEEKEKLDSLYFKKMEMTIRQNFLDLYAQNTSLAARVFTVMGETKDPATIKEINEIGQLISTILDNSQTIENLVINNIT